MIWCLTIGNSDIVPCDGDCSSDVIRLFVFFSEASHMKVPKTSLGSQ